MKDIRAFAEIVNMILYILDKKQKKSAIGAFFAMIVCSCFELLGVSLIYPFLQVIMEPYSIYDNKYLKWISIYIPKEKSFTLILLMGVGVAIVFVIKNLVYLISVKKIYTYVARLSTELSTEMLRSYISRPYEFFLNTNSSEIIRGIINDTDAVYSAINAMLRIASQCLTFFAICMYLAFSDLSIFMMSLIVCGISFYLSIILFKKKTKYAGDLYTKETKNKYQHAYQSVEGIKEIKVMHVEKAFVSKFNIAANRCAEAIKYRTFISACPERFIEGTCIGSLILIICFKFSLGVNVNDFIPTMGVFAMGAFRLLPSLSMISASVNEVVFYQYGVKNCYYNTRESRNLNLEQLNAHRAICNKESKESFEEWNELKLNEISFSYSNNEKVLSDVSLSIKNGESVGLIGPSGSGKTTLADILLGILFPQRGTITIDGIDIYEDLEQWSRKIGYVPQTVYLIDDTIEANIALGEEIIDYHKLEGVLHQSQLYEFAMNLPDKTNTIVGDRGVRLSGGQRQRIAIARALYNDPDIIVFDEATSALDMDTEEAVMQAIDNLSGKKTLIIIAHRLSTIKNCDKIYEINKGRAISKVYDDIIKSN